MEKKPLTEGNTRGAQKGNITARIGQNAPPPPPGAGDAAVQREIIELKQLLQEVYPILTHRCLLRSSDNELIQKIKAVVHG